jgi:hypothetical protein
MIVYFPGAFKPPHRGHFSIVETLLKNKKITKIHILISKKSRKCSLENSKIEFTPEQSKKIWDFYIRECVPLELRDKIKVKISFFPSPIYQMFYDIQQELKKKKEIGKKKHFIIIKSSKDESNERFSILNKLVHNTHNVRIEYKVMNTYRDGTTGSSSKTSKTSGDGTTSSSSKTSGEVGNMSAYQTSGELSATDFRCFIEKALKNKSSKILNNNRKKMMKYYPPCITIKKKKELAEYENLFK